MNNVSGFFVIIAVGLASDASAHYCHAFLESSKPTSRERAVEALDLLGATRRRSCGRIRSICAAAASVRSAPRPRHRVTRPARPAGPSIFLGGTSTLFGIGLTGLSITYVFQTFFKHRAASNLSS